MSLRVLVAEDVHDSADSMALLLKSRGYPSTVIYDGKGAIELAAALRPELVFLDIGLAYMNGCIWSVVETCRQRGRSSGLS
jgi:CheY-like chemotaxis protein